jgi:hypothetical protein
VLLSAGSVVYNGPTSTVEAYFSTLGYDTPRGENPADFFMHVLQLGPEETDDNGTPACDLPGAWVERGADFEDYSGAPALETLPDLKVTDMGDGVPVWYQFLVLFHRCLVDNLKDKEVRSGRSRRDGTQWRASRTALMCAMLRLASLTHRNSSAGCR